MRKFDSTVWRGMLTVPKGAPSQPLGKFYTNRRTYSSENFILFYSENDILKIFYAHNEIICSNYMEKYGIDYERK
jgi:hypothetical protein